MRRDYTLTYTGDEVQALLDKINALGLATITTPGLMRIEDKAKLDALGIHINTTDYWDNATGYVPAAGEIVIYSDYRTVEEDGITKNVPGIKIGSGNAYVQDLAMVAGTTADEVLAHLGDTIRHITAAERQKWNRKLNVDDAREVVDEALVFIRN